jgi:hypothetical protein
VLKAGWNQGERVEAGYCNIPGKEERKVEMTGFVNELCVGYGRKKGVKDDHSGLA